MDTNKSEVLNGNEQKNRGQPLRPRKITYVQYSNPAGLPPLQHSSRILANARWQVLFLGTGAFGTDSLSLPPHPDITVRRLPFCPAGWRQKLHYMWFSVWVIVWTLRWRPAWIYASNPLSCLVALLLSHLPSLQIIYHEHDSPSTSNSKFMQLALWARRWLAQRAALCVMPNEQRADLFAQNVTNAQRVLTVWNCPEYQEIAPQQRTDVPKHLWVLYHGSIVPTRLPISVLEALAMLPETARLQVIGYETVGYQGYVQTLQYAALRLRISHRVRFADAVPRDKLLKRCRRYDVGLALMPRKMEDVNMVYMTGASNKPFDYLACGLALLVSDLPDWRAMYVEPGYGLACDPDDPESIAAALRWFLEHPVEMREMGEQGRQRILAEWNYETQFAPVLERMNRTLR